MSKFFIFYEISSPIHNIYYTVEYSISDDKKKVIYKKEHKHTSKNQAFLYASVIGCPMFSFDEVVDYIMNKKTYDKQYLVPSDIKNFRNILDN